jgi:outer membrane protein OmpA-like peptidoglycan-associated protein
MGKSPSSLSGSDTRRKRPAYRLAVVTLLLGLGACNPIDTWRDWTGRSQNDPDPDTTPNTQNLAAGEASDYPNLATVPPPPNRAMTAAERDKLAQSLIADRANARYSDEQLRAGFSTASAPPPPPPGAPAPEPAGAQSEPVAAAPPTAPAPAPTAPPAAPSVASTGNGAAGDKPARPPPRAAARTAPAGGKTLAGPDQGLRKQGEPPESGPMESSLETPQPRATPQPEQIEPPPPPPQLPPTPKVANASPPLPGGLSAGGALARTPLPDAKAAAGFEPPPAAPELPPPAPARSAAAAPGKGGQKPPAPVATPVAEIKFAADSTSITDTDRQTLQTIVPLYQQNPGKVRIVGYAAAGSGAVEQLNAYRAALDRAQAVGAALTRAGIPSDKIQAEAAPAGANSGEGRAEVLIEH